MDEKSLEKCQCLMRTILLSIQFKFDDEFRKRRANHFSLYCQCNILNDGPLPAPTPLSPISAKPIAQIYLCLSLKTYKNAFQMVNENQMSQCQTDGDPMLEESYNDLIKKERIEDANIDQMHLDDQFDPAVKRETATLNDKTKHQPSQQDLCETVVLLKKIMPHRSLERAITMLYQTLIKKLPPQQVFPAEQHQLHPFDSQNQIHNQTQIKQFYSKADLQKTEFPSQYDQQKYKQRRLIAKAFVAKGYGHQHAIQQFKKAKLVYIDYNKFTKEAYKLAMSSIAIQAFRRLELFLKEKCKKKFNFASRDEMKKIMNPLLSPSHFGDSIPVFKKYFRLLYGLSNVTLYQHQSVKFYELAMREIHGPSYTIDTAPAQPYNQSQKENEIDQQQQSKSSFQTKNEGPLDLWTDQQDKELIETYTQCQSMLKTVDLLKNKNFPHTGLEKINMRMIKLTQQAIKKIQKQAQKQCLQVPTLSNNDINSICRTQSNINLRIQILKLLLTERVEKDQLTDAVRLLRRVVEEAQGLNNQGDKMIDITEDIPKNQQLGIYEQSGQDVIKQEENLLRNEEQPYQNNS